MTIQVRTNDGRGLVDVDADIVRSELGFISFYRKRTTTLRREACTVGLWPFRKTFPERDEKITNEDWVLSLAPAIIVEIRAAQGIEAATAAETVEQGSVHESPVPQGCAQTAPKGAI